MKQSAGIVLYKKSGNEFLFFIVHPGGPYWKNKDDGAWSIPKGEFTEGEDPLSAALREFSEETGVDLSKNNLIALDPVKTRSGKMIYAWALEKDMEASHIKSNTFEIEWPPRSGKKIQVPEIDRGEWFDYRTTLKKINPSQAPLIEQLKKLLSRL